MGMRSVRNYCELLEFAFFVDAIELVSADTAGVLDIAPSVVVSPSSLIADSSFNAD